MRQWKLQCGRGQLYAMRVTNCLYSSNMLNYRFRRGRVIVVSRLAASRASGENARIVSAPNNNGCAMRRTLGQEARESFLLEQRVSSGKQKTIELTKLHGQFTDFEFIDP